MKKMAKDAVHRIFDYLPEVQLNNTEILESNDGIEQILYRSFLHGSSISKIFSKKTVKKSAMKIGYEIKLSNDKSYTTSSLFENPIAINETGKENDNKYYYRYLFDHEKKDLNLPKNSIFEPPYDISSLGSSFDQYEELIENKEKFVGCFESLVILNTPPARVSLSVN